MSDPKNKQAECSWHRNLWESLQTPTGFALLVLVVTALRIAALPLLPIFFDEAQYWTWSRDIDWGYFSKPPIVAWLIWLTTEPWGQYSPFFVKLSAPILYGISTVFIYHLGSTLSSRKVGTLGGIFFLTLPITTLGSAFISADAPLVFFWTVALFALAKAPLSDKDNWWLVVGLMAGFGLLSKYTMGMFALSTFILLLSHEDERKLLRNLAVWIGLMIAAVMFLPNLIWNLAHDFVSFQHTGTNMLSQGVSVNFTGGLEFLASQFGVFGPILFALLLWHGLRLKTLASENATRFYLCFTLPLLFVAIILAFISGAQAHWAAPAYITGSLLLAHLLLQMNMKKTILTVIVLHGVLAILFPFTPILAKLSLSDAQNPWQRVERWNALAPITTSLLNQQPGLVPLTDERKIIAPLSYHFRQKDGTPYPIIKWHMGGQIHDHYDLNSNLMAYAGYDMLFITRQPDITRQRPYFRQAIKLYEAMIHGEKFYFYRLNQFQPPQ